MSEGRAAVLKAMCARCDGNDQRRCGGKRQLERAVSKDSRIGELAVAAVKAVPDGEVGRVSPGSDDRTGVAEDSPFKVAPETFGVRSPLGWGCSAVAGDVGCAGVSGNDAAPDDLARLARALARMSCTSSEGPSVTVTVSICVGGGDDAYLSLGMWAWSASTVCAQEWEWAGRRPRRRRQVPWQSSRETWTETGSST